MIQDNHMLPKKQTVAQGWWIGLVNAPAWIVFCLDVARHWVSISGDGRLGAVGVSLTFPLLWFYLLREQNSIPCLVASTLAFAASAQIVISL
jgi:hypothetical protein